LKGGLAAKETASTQGPALSPAQSQAWNAALEALGEAEKLYKEGDQEKARQAVARAEARAMLLPPAGAPIWLSIARHLIGLGAVSDADEALARSGNEAGIEEARADLRRVRRWYGLPVAHVPAPAEHAYARSFDELVKLKAAGPALAEALATYPHAPGLLMLDCENRLRAGSYRQARALCQVALEGFPELARAHCLLGLTHLNEGRRAEATTHLRQAVELAPKERLHWEALGNVYRLAGKHEELQKRFDARLP
jgi:tetratricopeptide (TPR) repeat protein